MRKVVLRLTEEESLALRDLIGRDNTDATLSLVYGKVTSAILDKREADRLQIEKDRAKNEQGRA